MILILRGLLQNKKLVGHGGAQCHVRRRCLAFRREDKPNVIPSGAGGRVDLIALEATSFRTIWSPHNEWFQNLNSDNGLHDPPCQLMLTCFPNLQDSGSTEVGSQCSLLGR